MAIKWVVEEADSSLAMAKNINDAVREVCLSFPETEERPSRGSPNFCVGGKAFAIYVVNHHGDGRIALWLNVPEGSQEFYTNTEAEYYCVPPYLGPRGWLGVHLDKGLCWRTIAERVREAYEHIAPNELTQIIGETMSIEPPTETIPLDEFDPLSRPRAQGVLSKLREICFALPETTEGTQFGNPAWKAGKKTFVIAHSRGQIPNVLDDFLWPVRTCRSMASRAVCAND